MKQRIPKGVLITVAALVAAGTARAQTTRTWTGGVNSDWHTAGNWSGSAVPADGDTVVIPSGTVAITNATAVLAAFTNVSGVVTFSNWWARLEATEVSLTGGTLRPNNAFLETDMSNRVWIVCSNLTVGASAVVHADALGYLGVMAANGQGPGKSYASTYRTGGAGFGGRGGWGGTELATPGTSYGDFADPVAPGSSSAGRTQTGNQKAGKNGGGAIRIDATGDITLAGRVSADGAGYDSYIGGGSGGGIRIQCRTLQGNGTIRANGGDARGGGGEGGGGRIALLYDTAAQASTPLPALTLSASAGRRDHHTESQFGTIYLPDASLLSESVSNVRGWLHIPGFTSWAPASLTLTNSYLGFAANDFQFDVAGAVGGSGDRMLALGTNAAVTVGGDCDAALTFLSGGSCAADGNVRIPTASWNNYHSLTAEADVTADGDMTIQGVWRFTSAPTNPVSGGYGSLLEAGGDMRIVTNALLYLYSNPTNGGSAVLRMDSLLVTTGAVVNANDGGFAGRHNAAGYGPGGGGGSSTYGGGGGHGGPGGLAYGGVSNGLPYAPLWPGSAGGGRSASGGKAGNVGGGLVRIEARGRVTVDGTLTANGSGALSYTGSGAGGGIFIRSASFGGAASGVLRANGGYRNTSGGAGGGGRIAVWTGDIGEAAADKIFTGQHESLGSRFSATTTLGSFAGSATVAKGTGTADGAEDGTVFFVTVLPPPGTLLLLR